ncbi:S9 family peptidase [Deminuibacter soli]|uniref:S9 family peptidase n=1 Tax=Deminuibacter soli TaxID=2291815 RepID=A0A3E1NQV9_9BACT|nr:prolyl oligopeptidase family serine peptidase [Deminuibacter soli]RFM30290.1 S9 family peptidase [Deminuibacter soli]
MRLLMKWLLACMPMAAVSQTLTVEKIMQDPKWIGTSPSNVFWHFNSKQLYFDWNPGKQISDSGYSYKLKGSTPEKAAYKETLLQQAIDNGVYNNTHTQIAYTFRGDIFRLDVKTGKTTRITQTEEYEGNPRFIKQDSWITYLRNQNLYAWDASSGETLQLTNFTKGDVKEKAGKDGAAKGNAQEQWLQKNQLQLMQVIRERKQKKDAKEAFLNAEKDNDTLRVISIGDKNVSNIQVSPTARFITYRLVQPPKDAKNTMVPDYVTESGFTTDIPGRTKVGAPLGKYEFYVFDTEKDTVIQVLTDSLPGIADQPDYVKDYPQKEASKKTTRGVIVNGPYWNQQGTAAIVDIRSQDNKDRWLMQLDAATGKLSLVDRQRDEAWVGGPGIGYAMGGATLGWINDQLLYFQSEATGYAHLYTYHTGTHNKQAITSGRYEVQQVQLSTDKKFFYLLTNEVHPGKQNWYRIKTDGSAKEKITSMDGGYEVSLSPDEKYIAYRYSYINKPWELYVQENTPGAKPQQVTFKAASDSFKAYPWRETNIFTITARDGKNIYARLYKPAASVKNGAAVIFVHGAGYLQNVHYWWSQYFREYMFNNLLADKGYTVLDIDYRASSGHGRDWRTGIYRYMGGKDLDDEVDAAHYLVKEMGIDSTRIGMYGGSYGGFMTLMAMFTQPDVIKAGAALRPVTDWAHYNHGYTSNILNEPFNDSIAYQRSSPINFAGGLKNNLLICHGMVDTNVNFQDVVRLNQRLIELGKNNWSVALYPMEDHGFVEPTSWTDEYKRILNLFDTKLLK